MISPCETGIQDAVVRDMSYPQSLDIPHTDDDDRHSGTWRVCTEDQKHRNESKCSNIDDQDYIEKINEFQFYVDTVKKIAKPGCSPEMVNVALSSMSSLLETLATISSKQCLYASL